MVGGSRSLLCFFGSPTRNKTRRAPQFVEISFKKLVFWAVRGDDVRSWRGNSLGGTIAIGSIFCCLDFILIACIEGTVDCREQETAENINRNRLTFQRLALLRLKVHFIGSESFIGINIIVIDREQEEMLIRICIFSLFLFACGQDVVLAFVNRVGITSGSRPKYCPPPLFVATTPSKGPSVSASKTEDGPSKNLSDLAKKSNKFFNRGNKAAEKSNSDGPDDAPPNNPSEEITAKSVTNEIMVFFSPENRMKDVTFQKRLNMESVKKHIDGLHIITLLFQSARSRRLAKTFLPTKFMYDRLKAWDREWSERDISMFVYGARALEGLDAFEGKILELSAKKINKSPAVLSSRAIGNALYGLQDLTSAAIGAPELCAALAEKVTLFNGDLNGQDIGIGMYGLQGMSADVPQVRGLIDIMATKVASSTCEFDSQAMSNALYGLQSMDSDYPEVLRLVTALATKVSESQPVLSAQAIGNALYGLQKLSSDKLEVRTLVATLAEKLEASTITLDAQAIGNALFGLQRMNSNTPEVQ